MEGKKMQEKDFIAYEYKTISVKAKLQSRAIDMYEAFGWEITSVEPSVVGSIILSLKRDRKIKHKAELNKIERQAEEIFEVINGLNKSKTSGASVFSYIFGTISALLLGGGMSLTMTIQNNVPAFAGGIILGIVGIVCCGINYLIYKKLVAKKTKSILPVIDDNEEKLANLLEKGNNLLNADII